MKGKDLNLEEAKEKQKDFKAEWFCPLIKEICNTTCVFYSKPYLDSYIDNMDIDNRKNVPVRVWCCEDGKCKLKEVILNQLCENKRKQKERDGD